MIKLARTQTYTAQELKVSFKQLLETETAKGTKANRHAKIRFKTAIAYLSTVKPSSTLKIRKTTTNYNVGDLMETILKLKMNKSTDERVSTPFEKDLQKSTYNEVKAIPASNIYPNGWHNEKDIEGVLIATYDMKVYYLPKKLMLANAHRMRYTKKNGYQLTNKLVKDLVKEKHIKPHYYTKLLSEKA